MAAMSRGPTTNPASKAKAKFTPTLTTPKRVRAGTASTRNHVFKGFSQRIAQIKIEPVRRGRSTLLDDAELESTFSYFRDALLEWRELNMSEAFTGFARKVAPLCDSLPQLLHHSSRIFHLLVEHIEHGEKFSQEPLLSLMAHLAHDLGEKFEQYFEKAVRTVSHLAATHGDVEVIEWSFACLAWLFKYLSRLLVPDLRPVFQLMAPLLGRQHQKAFVSRFAAESLSFLIRKAGAAHHRDSSPLQLIIRHISEQLIDDHQELVKEYEFRQGLMYLLTQSLKGVHRGFHSSASAILQELLAETYHKNHVHLRRPPLESVLVGVITAAIHHSDAENFEPLLETVLAQIKVSTVESHNLGLSARLLLLVCGVRGGTRINNWKPVLASTQILLDFADTSTILDAVHVWELLSTLSVVFQYCAVDAAIPFEKLLERLSQGQWEKYFLSFCNLYAGLGTERFKALLFPYFKRFVSQKAHKYEPLFCVVLSQLYQGGALSKGAIQPSERWESSLTQSFQSLIEFTGNEHDRNLKTYHCNALLDVIGILKVPKVQIHGIQDSLGNLLEHAVSISHTDLIRVVDIFATGGGLQFLVESDHNDLMTTFWPALCEASAVYGQTLTFWNTLLTLLRREKTVTSITGLHMIPLKRTIMQCLGSPSHELRLAVIQVLEEVVGHNEELRNIVSIAATIEQTPLDLENQRSITMRMGQLAQLYPALSSDDWVGEAIPAFCFGLLHVRLASVWDDTCSALRAMCSTQEGESFVTQTVFGWLNISHDQRTAPNKTQLISSQRPHVNDFECTNLIQLQEHISYIQVQSDSVEDQLEGMFDEKHVKLPLYDSFCRTQALRLMNFLPYVAEKRSRLLVPVLLNWTLDRPTSNSEDIIDVPTEAILVKSEYVWARKDQKAMLSVFSKFSNPKVLYRTNDVRASLLALLSNGDTEIQRAALKALLSWKDTAIVANQEQLLNLLDDARFRYELPIFLSDGKLQDEDIDQLLPIVLRLLYGKVVAEKRGQESKRKAVFVALKNRFGDDAIHQFLEIAFGPLANISILRDSTLDTGLLQEEILDTRKQFGMLNLLDDLLSTFKTTFGPFTRTVVDPILYSALKASRDLSTAEGSSADDDRTLKISLLKRVRQRALQILARLSENCPEFYWSPYIAVIVKEVIDPRLDKLPIETAQSVSSLLRLFAAWSKSPLTAVFLVEHNKDILIKVLECLEIPSAKDEVKCFILDDIIRNIVSLMESSGEISTSDSALSKSRIFTELIQPYSIAILCRVGNILRQSPSKEVLESGVQTVADLAPHVVGSAESRSMIEIATFLLRQPSKRVNAQTKLALLRILHEFIQRCDGKNLKELFQPVFDAVSPLFAFVQDRTARSLLCDIVSDLAANQRDLVAIAKLCQDLNSFTKGRLDEPDFERRSRAFNEINEGGYRSYSITQWKPLAYNMLHLIKDTDELSIRVNASLSIRRLIEISESDDFRTFVTVVILPGIHHGMRETSELVRAEFLAVLEHLVKIHRNWASVTDLHILLSEDDEASFFSNILHVQGHRRLRALRRLAAHASYLRGGHIYHILIPLLEHFVFNKADDEGADNLLGETIRTMTALTEGLEWPQFRSLSMRYIGYLTSKEDMQKPLIRLIAGLMDGLNQAGHAKGYINATATSHNQHSTSNGLAAVHAIDFAKTLSTLAKTLPQQEKLMHDLTNTLLSDLTDFLHKKEEATVSLRVPIAIAVAKILLLLPPLEIETRLPAILLDICYILKSRAQDSRDMSRNTLGEIATLMGPSYLGFIVKALRTALQRGYQLHVLSYTVHHILVKLAEQTKAGDLDYCLTDLVDVIMDDTFGITGQEKDAEDYISKMKEVKSSKSFDSMDIVARSASPAYIIRLVIPIKSLLIEKLNTRMVQKIDELLRRIGLGILQNPAVNDRDTLVFCYELIQEVYAASTATDNNAKIDPKNKRYLVNSRGAAKSGARLPTSSYLYKMVRFGLDILRTVLRKHDKLQIAQNLAGFLPIIGDAMVQGQEEVQVSAVRLLTTIIKVPMAELDTNCSVYIDEAIRAIKGAPSSNTELAQASLKLISAVLRGRSNVEVKERDVGHLIKRILPDLDEPDRSGATFGFLKAVMNRLYDVPEIYEAMDKVAEMMITNQTKSARDIARNHYFQFLTSYTQSEKRFKKQMEFLLKNLRYEHVEGRQSVMDALDLIITKALPRFPEQAQYDYHGMAYLPLINTVANDDSSKCRELASLLIKTLFQYASDKRLQSFATDLRIWLNQDQNAGLKRLGIQCWGFYFEALNDETEPKELSYVLERLDGTIDECLMRCNEEDWELLYYALNFLSKVCKKYAFNMFSSSKESLWTAIQASTVYPHAWVKLKAAELIGTLFAHLGISNRDSGLDALPLVGSGGLQLAEQSMTQLSNAFLKNLLSSDASEQLCMQSVKNIAFLARCLTVNEAKWQWQQPEEDTDMEQPAIELDIAAKDSLDYSGEDFDGFSPPPGSGKSKQAKMAPPAAIHRLMIRLSGIIRKDKSSLNAKTAIMNLFDTIVAKFPLEPLSTSLPHFLSTLNTFVDPATTIPRAFIQATTLNEPDDTYKSLIDKAREIMSILQRRMGTQEYLKVIGDVQKGIRERREERRRKRKVEAVADPEKWGREKRRRNDVKRVKRKEKGVENRGRRRGW